MGNDFWIGDCVLLKKSGRKGIVNGLASDGKIIVLVDGRKVITSKGNIQLMEEDSFTFPDWVFENNKPVASEVSKNRIPDTIDLHIEVLAPSRINDPPGSIFDFQVRKALEFVQEAYSYKYPSVKVICGKGQGVLRLYLIEAFRGEECVKLISEQHDGGALQVWLNIK